MPHPYEGGCVCRRLRFRVSAEPLTVYACHCSDCQVHSGSAFGLRMFVQREAVELLAGEGERFEVRLDERRIRRGMACSACHSILWGEPANAPAIANLSYGCLDDACRFEPIAHIWTASAQPWVRIPEWPLNDPGQPADYLPMLRAWRERHPAG